MGPVLIYEISSYGDVKLARTMDIQKHCNIESPKGFEIFKYTLTSSQLATMHMTRVQP